MTSVATVNINLLHKCFSCLINERQRCIFSYYKWVILKGLFIKLALNRRCAFKINLCTSCLWQLQVLIIFRVKLSVVVRIHIGHYKVRYLWLCIPRNKSWIEAWLKLKKKIKDFTYLLIIHVSKENLSVLKVRIHIGKL